MTEATPKASESNKRAFTPFGPTLSIFWISVFGLFLELLVIRWIGTEIRIFAYLQNTVLVVCFLGLGAGCFTARRPVSMHQLFGPLVILSTLMVIPTTREFLGEITQKLGSLGDINIWYAQISHSIGDTIANVTIGLLLTLGVMVLIVYPFVPIGRLLGRWMDDHPKTVVAYSANVAGSLLGTWLFVALSVINLPPFAWLTFLFALSLPFFWGVKPRPWLEIGASAALIGLSLVGASLEPGDKLVWSPYQKLSLVDLNKGRTEAQKGTEYFRININNVGYQGMLNLSKDRPTPPSAAKEHVTIGHTQYDMPALLHPMPQSMLIVGAGSGNDAAGALRNNVEKVVAVEIDPAIVKMGTEWHPEKPYEDPRVSVVIDDARSVFSSTDSTFDVISFGLLDSHTTTAMTNARLDHYVYTRESIERVKSLLNPGGIVALSFEARKPHISGRVRKILKDVFGQSPLVFRIPHSELGWGGVMFVAGDLTSVAAQLNKLPALKKAIQYWQSTLPIAFDDEVPITTDDWPYLYLAHPTIPPLYMLLAGLMFLLVVILQKSLNIHEGLDPRQWKRFHWHFFFLGAAFLLLEVQNISKATVALGSTWWVNGVIISGVLGMILLANALSAWRPRLPLAPVFVLLLGSVIALYFVDLAWFGALPFALKAIAVGAVTTLPMLFSGIIFIRSFEQCHGKALALGANLLGALAGAILQSVSFLTGVKLLLVLVFLFYVLALMTIPKSVKSA